MATKNPRISVMLKPDANAILTRLAAVTKQSKSSLIADLIQDTCLPMFERMTIVLEAAATATDEAKTAARQSFADAEQKLLGIVGMTTDLFDVASLPILESSERSATTEGTGRAARAAGRAAGVLGEARPPHVTRGSGIPKSSDKTAKSPMKAGSKAASPQNTGLNASKRPSMALKKKVGG